MYDNLPLVAVIIGSIYAGIQILDRLYLAPLSAKRCGNGDSRSDLIVYLEANEKVQEMRHAEVMRMLDLVWNKGR